MESNPMNRTRFAVPFVLLALACSQHESTAEPVKPVETTAPSERKVMPAIATIPAAVAPMPVTSEATPVAPQAAAAPTKPQTSPIDAKIAELKLRNNPTTLHNGMEMIERLHAEEKLETWAKGDAADPNAVLEFAARMTNVLERIKWTEHKKRERNPQEYDRIVKASLEGTRALPNFVKDTEAFKKAADGLVQTCVDCHTLFK